MGTYLEVWDKDFLHKSVKGMATAGAYAFKDVYLFVLGLDDLSGSIFLLLLDAGQRLLFRSGDESQINILLKGSRVRAHIPLGIRHAADKLDPRVSRRVIEFKSKSRHWNM
jgi:hypothetical protein